MRALSLLVLLIVAGACNLEATPKPTEPKNLTGVLGAASYEIDVPAVWNGTLFLYSHGYVAPGSGNPALSAPPEGRAWLLDHHFAAAGSAYASTGWAVEEAFRDQIALLDLFDQKIGKPKRVIAWGHSMGGLISAGLGQLHPSRFAAEMPLCGALAGGIANWNAELDAAYAFKELLAPHSALELVHISDALANQELAQQILSAARKTLQGRARLALVAAIIDIPGWFDPRQPEPASTDFTAQAAAQASWESLVDFSFAFRFRQEVEQRAGGNPSWNTGVDYSNLLSASPARTEVGTLYAEAGLDLQKDLRALSRGANIKADAGAAQYLERNISLDGDLAVPTLSMHTTGDGLATAPNESAFGDVVRRAGKADLLRTVFVHRAGHCTFTSAETIAALQVLLKRLDTGVWDDAALQPAALNAASAAQGDAANQFFGFAFAPSFVTYSPPPFPRPHAKWETIQA